MEEKKVHPSELLEFTSVSPQLTHHHIEQTEIGRPESGSGKGEVKTKTASFNGLYKGLTNHAPNLPSIGSDALAASQSEHRMTFRQALKLYPKAIGWSAIISLAIIMEGYDTGLINSFYAFPEFVRNYGIRTEDGEYQITSKWQASISNGSVVGSIIGLFANGVLTELFGYRYTMMGALVSLALFVFLAFFAYSIEYLLASQILCGIPWGVFSTLTTTYAAEVMPLNLRAYLTSNVNLCWLLGQITALGILRGLLALNSQWSYRIPFGLQWVWIVFILIGTILAPESPWWLLRKGRTEEAKRVLLRLTRRNQGFNADNTIAMMQHTNNVEKHLRGQNNTRSRWKDFSYADCFRGPNLRRTEIACAIFMTQNLCGLPVIGYAAYFYRQLGFDTTRSFNLTMGMHGLAIFGAFISLVLMKHFGRRTLYISGLVGCFLILIAVGTLSTFRETTSRLWGMAGLIMSFIFVFDTTIGPLTYTLVAELPSTRLRVKTVVLARVAYNVTSLLTNLLQQRMLNPLAWDWRGKTCFFWAGSCALCLVYCYFRLPETWGLSYHELDILFEKKADARSFAKFQQILEKNGYFSFYEEPAGDGDARGSVDARWL